MRMISANLSWSRLKFFLQKTKSFKDLKKTIPSTCLDEVCSVQIQDRQFSSSGKKENVEKSNQQYCVDIVRKCDHENYLCSLLWRGLQQRASFAIRAFNVELAQVGDIVSENRIGLMRLKFWSDNIENMYKGVARETPVALELNGAVQYFKLKKRWLLNMIEARSEELQGKKFHTIDDVENYGEQTMAAINYLHLQVLGIENIHADHAASHIGKTQSLVTLLRATPYHASKRRLNLPRELLIKHKVSDEMIFRGSDNETVKDLVFEIASRANTHLDHARSFANKVPEDSFLAFLQTTSCDWYLKNLQALDCNVFDSKLQQKQTMLPMKLWLRKHRRLY